MKIYFVRNHEGKYAGTSYRYKWVDVNDQNARIFPKAATARSFISSQFKYFPERPICELVSLDIDLSQSSVVDGEQEVRKRRLKLDKAKLKKDLLRRDAHKVYLEREMNRINNELEKYR